MVRRICISSTVCTPSPTRASHWASLRLSAQEIQRTSYSRATLLIAVTSPPSPRLTTVSPSLSEKENGPRFDTITILKGLGVLTMPSFSSVPDSAGRGHRELIGEPCQQPGHIIGAIGDQITEVAEFLRATQSVDHADRESLQRRRSVIVRRAQAAQLGHR